MRESLYQNDHVRIFLGSALGGNDCWWADEDDRASFNNLNDACVRCGGHEDPEAIRLRIQVRVDMLDDSTVTEAHCCLRHTQGLFNDVFSEHKTELDEYDGAYHSTRHLRTTGGCLWCGDSVHKQHEYYSLQNEAVVVHTQCAAQLGDVLRQAFDTAIDHHADELLPEVL